ncbi:integral membrane protein [Bordetella pertussis]|uniref:Integral membrane protein n=7 Tax=Bordetella pertussis TaxID=520 RepID=Q7VVQ6_BORPE|nr:metal-dependent hydrolase [Bordetella pertussis]ETH81365.1 putative membrane-bound metal-dependent hydrolase [Bordetella pertussis STO1-CHOC-0017]ETH87591.1 putative membrane-bound metal-dependent hydrolase [Bordetella pertussis STO1-CHOC-0018]KCV20998.1 putative membrane-bound metal-dependent hydrolase [Bordetella pertussis B200]AEE67822.1 integral membrane protein [Bordetella pertussis CS]AIW91709.1 integral membrane protein [Bordetella pertussis B1917]
MDSVTQVVLGAAIQGSMLGRSQGRKALLYGGLLGTLPDLDVLMRYPDPVSLMTYHRGFSHSILVLTALAAVMAWLIRRRWSDAPYSGRRLFATLLLVLVTHPVLDAFTVYGTQLFWPFPLVPESWSAVFIIDPVYTVPMLAAVLVAAWRGMTPATCRGLAATVLFGAAYLLVALTGRFQAETSVTAALRERGEQVEAVLATPMPFNTLLWRVIAKTGDGAYYEAVSGRFDRQPPEMARLPLHTDVGQALAGVPLHERLRWFTNDWLRYDALGDALVVTDLRMGIAGYYTFRFVMAERDGDRWRAVTPRRWPSDRGNWEQMRLTLARIVGSQPLPLARWARQAEN